MTLHLQQNCRLLILGSCVSRDILSITESKEIILGDYYARSSIASLASKPFALGEECLQRIPSDFQRRMVRRDVEKSFFKDISSRKDFDLLLIDLIDERFDLYEIYPGSIVTVSSEFLAAYAVTPSDRSSNRWIPSGSERHRELWKAGVERLFSTLTQHGLAERVIINKVFWADQMEDGTPLPEQQKASLQAANSLLEWMYAELRNYVPQQLWMEFPEKTLRSSSDHRWGFAPFHYSKVYYIAAAAQLMKLYWDYKNVGGTIIDNQTIIAWSRFPGDPCRRTSFMVFKDNALVHTQPYSTNPELRFETGGANGKYEVVISILTLNFIEPENHSVHRNDSLLHFKISPE